MFASIPLVLGVCMAVGCLLAAVLAIKQQRARVRDETARLLTLQQKIETALNDQGFEMERAAFGAALKAASLTTDLQRPRLENLAKIDKQPPEKYRILGKLAAQGMNVEEIAAVLGISNVEAGQLLSLSSMAQCGR
jgi:SOS response regulatory protein OraA/RecX